MQHIVDWFVVFTGMICAAIALERLGTILSRQNTKRNIQTISLNESPSDLNES